MTSTTSQDRLDINLTPLLDLVLQLIMYFMLTVNFVRADQGIAGVDLPVAQSAMPLMSQGDNLVFITIGKDGECSAGEVKLPTVAELHAFIQGRKVEINKRGAADIVIVVRGDKDTSWGRVLETLDECRRAGCHAWQLRVIKPSS